MCGILGMMTTQAIDEHTDALIALIQQSKIRGLHSFGMAYTDEDWIVNVEKHFLIEEVVESIKFIASKFGPFFDIIMHARYSTSGDWQDLNNNQPISVDNWHLVFNGVISMKTKEEMEHDYNLKMLTDNDGELFLRHVMVGKDPITFMQTMTGSFAGLWYYGEHTPNSEIYAIRNARRPMWLFNYDKHTVMIASTKDIIHRALGSSFSEQAVECEPNKLYRLRDYCEDFQ